MGEARWWATASVVTLTLAASGPAAGQVDVEYFYDHGGRLSAAVDGRGTRIDYTYDAAGNLVDVARSTVAPGLVILDFSPRSGPVGASLQIRGRGFSPDPASNHVELGGVTASVSSATARALDIRVPDGARTGTISVTVAAGTAYTLDAFEVIDAPTILAISPRYALAGSSIALTAFGDVAGARFAFAPAIVPPEVTITSTSASMMSGAVDLSLDVAPEARGSFVLIATRSGAQSALFSTEANTLVILDPSEDRDRDGSSNADELAAGTDPLLVDTDGDGYPDGVEIDDGSDPLDPDSLPPSLLFAAAVAPELSARNLRAPQIAVAIAAQGSLQNRAAPEAVARQTSSRPVTGENIGSP